MEDFGVYKAALEEEENQEDPFFKRLPDELIISHILGKVSEAKSLCRCSLLSKRFSSLVYKTKNVSVKIPFHIPIPQTKSKTESTTRLAAFPGKLIHVVTYPLMFVEYMSFKSKMEMFLPTDTKFGIEFLMDKNNLLKFLSKFTRMESLIVEFDYSASFNFHKEPVIKWKLDMKSASFILLMAPKSISTSIHDDDDESRNRRYIYPKEKNGSNEELVFDCHLAIAICCSILTLGIVPFLPESVVKLVITDCKENGKIVFEESDFVGIRKYKEEDKKGTFDELKSALADKATHDKTDYSSSSCMKVVSFCLGKGKNGKKVKKGKKGKKGKSESKDSEGDYDDDDDDYLRVKNAFRGKKAVYFDVVMDMLMEIKGSF